MCHLFELEKIWKEHNFKKFNYTLRKCKDTWHIRICKCKYLMIHLTYKTLELETWENE